MITPAGTTTYSYDNDNRLQSVGDGVSPLATYFYDGVGNRTNLALANGITTDYSYDTLNRLTGIVSHKGPQVPMASYAYTLGAAGTRTSVTEQDGSVTHWAYDDIYRLLNETRVTGTSGSLGTPTPTLPPAATFVPVTSTPGATPTSSIPSLTATPTGGLPNTSSWNKSYTYDPVGNRLTQTANGLTSNYTYNALDQLTQAASSAQLAQYTYNARGDLTFNSTQPTGGASTITTYAWDARDQLKSVTQGGASAIYSYDASGRRIQRSSGGQITNYLWDELSANGDVVAETDSANNPLARYILGNGQLIAQERSGATSFYLDDGQHNVRALANSSGTITDQYTYDAYGNLKAQTGSTVNPYQFASQQFDPLSGLYDMRARYYDPSTGRFLSQDTAALNVQNPLELNRYGYTADNPVNYTDPSGHQYLTYGLITAQQRALAGTEAGFVGGLTGSGLLVLGSYLGICGNVPGLALNLPGVFQFITQSAVNGALLGAVLGGFSGLSAVAETLVTGSGALILSYSLLTINQIPDLQTRLCEYAALTVSLATSAAFIDISNNGLLVPNDVSDAYIEKYQWETRPDPLFSKINPLYNSDGSFTALKGLLDQLSQSISKYPVLKESAIDGANGFSPQGGEPSNINIMKDVFEWADDPVSRPPPKFKITPKGLLIFDEAEAALAHLNDIQPATLNALSPEILVEWAKLYVQTALSNTGNAVAVGRGLLMIRALEKFYPGFLSKAK